MTDVDDLVPDSTVRNIEQAIARSAFAELTAFISPLPTGQIVAILERLDSNERAVAYRMLPKGRALEVFDLVKDHMQLERELGEAMELAESQIDMAQAELMTANLRYYATYY